MLFAKKSVPGPVYALCELVTASPTSPHHIRVLTDAGMKKSGGADTPALCGADVAWDTTSLDLADLPRIIEHNHATYRICQPCADVALAV